MVQPFGYLNLMIYVVGKKWFFWHSNLLFNFLGGGWGLGPCKKFLAAYILKLQKLFASSIGHAISDVTTKVRFIKSCRCCFNESINVSLCNMKNWGGSIPSPNRGGGGGSSLPSPHSHLCLNYCSGHQSQLQTSYQLPRILRDVLRSVTCLGPSIFVLLQLVKTVYTSTSSHH